MIINCKIVQHTYNYSYVLTSINSIISCNSFNNIEPNMLVSLYTKQINKFKRQYHPTFGWIWCCK